MPNEPVLGPLGFGHRDEDQPGIDDHLLPLQADPLTICRTQHGGDDEQVAHVMLFHSVYGRRPAVLAAASRLRAAGHTVTAPDLYAGRLAATVDDGFALCDRVGWHVIMRRAGQALGGWPPETVLAGLSMGAAVAAGLLAGRPATAGLLLLHNRAAATEPRSAPVCPSSCTSPTPTSTSPRPRSPRGSRP
jgi:dienelactone hydrolase